MYTADTPTTGWNGPVGHPLRAAAGMAVGVAATALLAALTGPMALAGLIWSALPWAVGEALRLHLPGHDTLIRLPAFAASLAMGLGLLIGSTLALWLGHPGALEVVFAVAGSLLAATLLLCVVPLCLVERTDTD